jgi:hypothetical protein
MSSTCFKAMFLVSDAELMLLWLERVLTTWECMGAPPATPNDAVEFDIGGMKTVVESEVTVTLPCSAFF